MEKPAETHHPIHDLLTRRWSPRAFAERPVESDKLHSIFEAAKWAPSSDNEQPWRFIVATKGNKIEWHRLFSCLVEGNQKWAHQAPILILSVASLKFEDGGATNRHAFHDTGMAVENLVLQATALGLAAHQMAGFRIDQARAEFKIPDGYKPVAMIAVGYPGDAGVMEDRLRQRELSPRQRQPIAEFVFTSEWKTPSSIVSP